MLDTTEPITSTSKDAMDEDFVFSDSDPDPGVEENEEG